MDSRMSSNALPLNLINSVESPNWVYAPVVAFSFRDPKIRTPSFTQFLFGCDVEQHKHQTTCGPHLYRTNVYRRLVSETRRFIHLSGSPTILLWLGKVPHSFIGNQNSPIMQPIN